MKLHTTSSGTGNKTIFFIHGNSSDSSNWIDQLQDNDLQSKYRMIAIDLPGHGRSPKSDDYTLGYLANCISNAILESSISEYILVGISYGTCLIGEVANKLPKGCKGFFLVASNLTNDAHPPGLYTIPSSCLVALTGPAEKDEINELALLFSGSSDNLSYSNYVETFPKADVDFRIALGKDIMENNWSDEWQNIIETKLPVAFVFGENEKAIKTNYVEDFPNKWGNEIHYIRGAAHFPNLDQPALFNSLLINFANDCWR